MTLDIATPALLFPAISLLLLAYTNRFITLANLIRSLSAQYRENADPLIPPQMRNLRYRLQLIRLMQLLGIASFLLCVVAMFAIFSEAALAGKVAFGLSLILLVGSLICSFLEIQVSIRALDAALDDWQEEPHPRP